MEKIWLVVNVNTYNYDDTELNTIVYKNKEEAVLKFNELSLHYLSNAKEIYSDKYSTSNDLSFSEYEKIAFDNDDSISVGCHIDNEDDKTLSIVNKFNTTTGRDEETFIVHMYPCIFGERDFSILAPVFNKENKSKEVEDFYKSLTK